jgi:hypothetical protein
MATYVRAISNHVRLNLYLNNEENLKEKSHITVLIGSHQWDGSM